MVEPRLSKAAYQDAGQQSVASSGNQSQSNKFKLQKCKSKATSNYDSNRRSRSLAGGPLSVASTQNAGAGASQAPSSVFRSDYNGKKSKILHTLKQIDDTRMGVVKSPVFQNLINCMDVELTNADMAQV